jgi:hypothetical protein
MEVQIWLIGKERELGVDSVETAFVLLCGRILLVVLDAF